MDSTATSDLAVYMRVSGEHQKRAGTIEDQRRVLDRYLRAYDITPYGWYEDQAYSGRWIPFGERPDGQRLLADAEAGHVKTVLVAKLDRFGRNAREIHNAVHLLEQAGARLVSLKEHFDTRDAAGKLMLGILAAVAEFEWEQIMERTDAGMERRLKSNGWMGGPVPYGYRAEGKGKDAALVVDEELLPGLSLTAADVVRLIFRLAVAEDKTTVDIGQHLDQLGVPTSFMRRQLHFRRGERDEPAMGVWRPNAVNWILSNPTYKGEYTFGRRSNSHNTDRPREVVTCEVPAIVPTEAWEAAQDALQRHQLFSSRNAQRDYLLRGLMRCGACGHQYIGDGSKYVCYAHRRPNVLYGRELAEERRCRTSLSIRAFEIEAAVWQDVEGYLRDPGHALSLLAERLHGHTDQADTLRAEYSRVQQEQATKQQEKDVVLRLFRQERINERDLDRQLDDIAREEVDLGKRAEALNADLTALNDQAAHLEGAAELLRSLRSRLDNEPLTPTMRHSVLESLVHSIIVRTEIDQATGVPRAVAHVTYRFDAPGTSGFITSTPAPIATPAPRTSPMGWMAGRTSSASSSSRSTRRRCCVRSYAGPAGGARPSPLARLWTPTNPSRAAIA